MKFENQVNTVVTPAVLRLNCCFLFPWQYDTLLELQEGLRVDNPEELGEGEVQGGNATGTVSSSRKQKIMVCGELALR